MLHGSESSPKTIDSEYIYDGVEGWAEPSKAKQGRGSATAII